MPERGPVIPAVGKPDHNNKEAVCIHTKKIYDACREEEESRSKFF